MINVVNCLVECEKQMGNFNRDRKGEMEMLVWNGNFTTYSTVGQEYTF